MKTIMLLTEENPTLLSRRLSGFQLNRDEILILSRFEVEDWDDVVNQIRLAAEKENLALVIIDTLSAFWGVKFENDPADILKAIQPLQELVQKHGLSVLALHHLRKAPGEEGTAQRGSGALTGAVDIALEFYRVPRAEKRRQIKSYSRFQETPPDIVIEWDDVANQYTSLGSLQNAKQDDIETAIASILATCGQNMTQAQILKALPDPKPSKSLLKKTLKDCHQSGLIKRLGAGAKGDAYRYSK